MKKINNIKQPTDYLCGQSCVAMLAGVTVEEVVSVMKNHIWRFLLTKKLILSKI